MGQTKMENGMTERTGRHQVLFAVVFMVIVPVMHFHKTASPRISPFRNPKSAELADGPVSRQNRKAHSLESLVRNDRSLRIVHAPYRGLDREKKGKKFHQGFIIGV